MRENAICIGAIEHARLAEDVLDQRFLSYFHFSRHRAWLGELCRADARLLVQGYVT